MQFKVSKTSLGWFDLILPVCILLLTLSLGFTFHRFVPTYLTGLLTLVVPFASIYVLEKRSVLFVIAIYAVMIGAYCGTPGNRGVIYSNRNFFGLVRVIEEPNNVHALVHGSTVHGRESYNEPSQCEPLAYYHRLGPFGLILREFESKPRETHIAVVGLGTGASAAYIRPNQEWTFYEINPHIVEIARNPRYFKYLSDCSISPPNIVLGDARLKLKSAANGQYDLLILDAFSSDAIPIHLMTLEALDLYLSKLAPHGLLVFHITNYYLDLAPVLTALATERQLVALELDDSAPSQIAGKDPSTWLILAHSGSDYANLRASPNARFIPSQTNGPVWTDDFSNIIGVFKSH